MKQHSAMIASIQIRANKCTGVKRMQRQNQNDGEANWNTDDLKVRGRGTVQKKVVSSHKRSQRKLRWMYKRGCDSTSWQDNAWVYCYHDGGCGCRASGGQEGCQSSQRGDHSLRTQDGPRWNMEKNQDVFGMQGSWHLLCRGFDEGRQTFKTWVMAKNRTSQKGRQTGWL